MDVEQNNMICNEPSTLHTHKEKYILDGMIDLTGKGPIVGVLKIKSKDAKNGDSMGRIQAKRRKYVSDHTAYHFFCIITVSDCV